MNFKVEDIVEFDANNIRLPIVGRVAGFRTINGQTYVDVQTGVGLFPILKQEVRAVKR